MKTTRHATYNLNYHIVWIPKSRRTDGSADIAEQGSAQYRQSVLVGDVATRVRDILHEIADDKGLEIIDLTVQPDHIHLFVSSPPKHAPSLLANWFKGISSRKYNHRHADHADEKIKWARGYYAGTAGHVSSETVEKYIQSRQNS
ncbi:IS200/IS605 family transposase [Haloferax larsenii]|uniref:Putative transposase n=1 Tax=Haloferax larsenii TaxID=302484 RepID=A0A1H7J9S5_HALLR|nr:IS200/IS605 family transposase [Haloferax larsenii]SEK71104.1 putative transposase [Haloferax larsenii]